MTSARANGVGVFFATHPVLFAMSLIGAWATSAYSFSRVRQENGQRRIGFAALGLLTAVEGIGIVVARRRAVR